MDTEDERIGQLLKAMRVRQGLTQAVLARAARIPRQDVIRIEAGDAGRISLDRLRAAFAAGNGRARLHLSYNGAVADRLLDERHAGLVELAVRLFQRRGWLTAIEVSFNEYGERGSIDLLAAHERTRVAAVCEIKSAFGSLEETNRVLDVKARLARKISKATFGWWPAGIARLLIVPETMTIRRVVERHASTMSTLYPARGREVRAWLRAPRLPFAGIWFVSEVGRNDSNLP